jgi:hypothetical protein
LPERRVRSSASAELLSLNMVVALD